MVTTKYKSAYDVVKGKKAEIVSLSEERMFVKATEDLIKSYFDEEDGSSGEIAEMIVELVKKLSGSEKSDKSIDIVNKQEIIETPTSKLRIQNFKHKQFAAYYHNLEQNQNVTTSPLSVSAETNLLSALRQQLTATALANRKLRYKANNLPVYRPVDKVDRETFKSYYKKKILRMMKGNSGSQDILRSEVQEKLRQELQSSLTDQLGSVHAKLELQNEVQEKLRQELQSSLTDELGRLHARLELKKIQEMSAKMKLQNELRKSLQQQLAELLQRQNN